MAGHLPISALTWLFGLASVAALLAVAWRFRRRPIVALMAAGERRVAFHRDSLAALDAAIAAADAEGRPDEAARLTPCRATHVHALRGLAAAREFAGDR